MVIKYLNIWSKFFNADDRFIHSIHIVKVSVFNLVSIFILEITKGRDTLMCLHLSFVPAIPLGNNGSQLQQAEVCSFLEQLADVDLRVILREFLDL